jgi:hypothetical protein
MAITYHGSNDYYGSDNISLSVTTGDLIIAMGTDSGTNLADLTFSGGGTWVHLTELVSPMGHHMRIGYILATTGSGSTTFGVANYGGDFSWCVHAYTWTSGIYKGQEISSSSNATSFSSGSGIGANTGSLRVGGIVSTGGNNYSNFSSWDDGFQNATGEITHFDMTCYLIDGANTTRDCSGINGANVESRSAWQVVFEETGAGGGATTIQMIWTK